jgi:hypothetical protein
LLTKPDSVDRAKALVRKLDEVSPPKSATRVVDGWLVVSDSERMIDRVLKGSTGRALANDATFKDAVSELPDDALAKAYVNGPRLAEVIGRYLDQATQTAASTPFGLDKLDWIAASLEAKEDGVRFDAGVKSADGGRVFGTAAPYASKLISGVPAGALAFLTFRGGTDQGGAIGEWSGIRSSGRRSSSSSGCWACSSTTYSRSSNTRSRSTSGVVPASPSSRSHSSSRIPRRL